MTTSDRNGRFVLIVTEGGPVSVQVEAGSLGFARGSLQASTTLGRTSVSVGLSGQGETGRTALDPAQVATANADRDGYRHQGATLEVSHRWGEGHTLALGLMSMDGRLDYDSQFGTPTDTQRSRTRKRPDAVNDDQIRAAIAQAA